MARPPIDRGEWDAVLELCCRKTESEYDWEYFYWYELDGKGRLKNWADTDSVIDDMMGCGDVVVFDTTCRTNKHGVRFVPFVGLSHHRTPIVLGCGVTSDQSLDSLVWLLRAFKQSNDRQNGPASVITDDSDAVAGAIKTVFPGSNHRFCSWHVEQGIEEHLRGSSAAQTEFRALMCDDACSPAAFQDRWYGFVAKHRTVANQRWLDAMYGKRKMWAAASVHHKFFLGMANDQRTECLATALHTGLREGMSLPDLWRHADACTHALRRDVAVLDHRAAMSRLALTTEHRRLEEHAARLFTPANFYLLREEIKMMGSFDVIVVAQLPDAASGDVIYFYTVAFNQCRGVTFRVRCSGDVVKCSCRKMERDGLPCRHILCVMRHTSMSQIPACCAPRRMTRRLDAKIERLDEMKDLGRQVFDLASEDAQEFQEIKEFSETWLEEKEKRRGSGAVAVEDNVDAADVESSTPVAKRIKLFDD
jgi:hypothetical protein